MRLFIFLPIVCKRLTGTGWVSTSLTAGSKKRWSARTGRHRPHQAEFWDARAITVIDGQARKKVLLTSRRDRRRYRAADIVACYERRWSIETCYRELKQTMLGTALTLRSKTVDGVYQETERHYPWWTVFCSGSAAGLPRHAPSDRIKP
jgi:hypothetical protein